MKLKFIIVLMLVVSSTIAQNSQRIYSVISKLDSTFILEKFLPVVNKLDFDTEIILSYMSLEYNQRDIDKKVKQIQRVKFDTTGDLHVFFETLDGFYAKTKCIVGDSVVYFGVTKTGKINNFSYELFYDRLNLFISIYNNKTKSQYSLECRQVQIGDELLVYGGGTMVVQKKILITSVDNYYYKKARKRNFYLLNQSKGLSVGLVMIDMFWGLSDEM